MGRASPASWLRPDSTSRGGPSERPGGSAEQGRNSDPVDALEAARAALWAGPMEGPRRREGRVEASGLAVKSARPTSAGIKALGRCAA